MLQWRGQAAVMMLHVMAGILGSPGRVGRRRDALTGHDAELGHEHRPMKVNEVHPRFAWLWWHIGRRIKRDAGCGGPSTHGSDLVGLRGASS